MAPTLTDFGHASMRVLGRKALGSRPLLVLLLEYDDNAQGDFPRLASVHPPAYYDQLSFGHPDPPFSTDSPVNPAGLAGYVDECSIGRFSLFRVAIDGPFPMGPFGNPDDSTHIQRVAQKVIDYSPWAFIGIDGDAFDLLVSSDELVVLVIENIRQRFPASRPNEPVYATTELFGGHPPAEVTVTLAVQIAFAGPFTPFYQIAHEVTHSLGTIDMYNPGSMNYLLTLMGAYPFYSNDQATVHLDAWHKLQLGWCEPRLVELQAHGSADVAEISAERPDGAVILWHQNHGVSEYFLLERRRANGPRKYDRSFPGNGLLIWHIDPARTPMNRGTPNLDAGSSGVWEAGTHTPPLHWSDGTMAVSGLTIAAGPNASLRITW
ncbi:hypothetical protein ACI2LO_33145 [Streptomyces sp. NPDC033754]|uniref:hypothetical protein n=1 Tax=unclassified Streptomyces TaxID=2593676 RepID=UPI0033F1D4AE